MKEYYNQFTAILKEELVPAQGCTEPIAIAYASAYAREILGHYPDKIIVLCSGNIIKNVKSVVVPNSNKMVGIKASALLGAFGGKSSLGMQVLSEMTEEERKLAAEKEKENICTVKQLNTTHNLHIIIEMSYKSENAIVEVIDLHDNIVRVEKNGKLLLSKKEDCDKYCGTLTPRDKMNFDNIYDYATNCNLNDVLPLIKTQIEFNYAIALEGLSGKYGLDIGNTTLRHYPDNVATRMKAYTIAASEARMCGCTLPVVTNSGSGNQGIATSVPLIVYAKENNIPEIKLYRSLIFANLITAYQKTFIGRLSAFCGAISATCGAISGIAYMKNCNEEIIKNTIINTLANDIGVVCDGAKSSCAAKISCGFDAGMCALYLAIDGKRYPDKCGIINEDVDKTIRNVGRMAMQGMQSTDKEILDIMLEN